MVELIWENTGVLRRLSGLVTQAELDSSAQKLQSSERIDDLQYIIHDFTGVTEVVTSQDDVDYMAVRASVALLRNRRVKIAFAGTHPVVTALIDAFNNRGISPLRCHRFDTLEEARRFASAEQH